MGLRVGASAMAMLVKVLVQLALLLPMPKNDAQVAFAARMSRAAIYASVATAAPSAKRSGKPPCSHSMIHFRTPVSVATICALPFGRLSPRGETN